jgi:acetylornithine deacetylase/succinyl-diaminopimelate desuccinylase-like protein
VLAAVRRVQDRCAVGDVFALTRALVAFQTVSAIADNPERARMGAFLAEWAREHGLVFRSFGADDAWEIELPGRTSERRVRWLVHGDVVPVNDPPALVAAEAVPEGWHFPPFSATEATMETASALPSLYGRGTEDDKGPLAAILVSLASLASAGLVPDGALVVAIGLAEEDDWEGMRRYAAESPPSTHTISVDAEFPVVLAQSGFVAWGLEVPPPPPVTRRARARAAPRDAEVVSMSGGLFLTQIPDRAELVLAPRPPLDAAALEARVRAALDVELASRDAADTPVAHDGFGGEVAREQREGREVVVLRALGVSTHASQPERGRNANELLAAIAARLSLLEGAATRMLAIVHAYFERDARASALGLAHEDALMGPLVAAPTVLRLTESGARLEVNMRRPAGRTVEAFRADLDGALARVRARFGDDVRAIDDVFVSDVHSVQAGVLSTTPTSIYAELVGLPAEALPPRSIRGGTYARLFPGAVDFGPGLPDRAYTGHGADEHLTDEAARLVSIAALETARLLAFPR